MKSSIVFFAATVCFVLGLGFYHYLLNHRVIFNGGLSRPLYVFDGTAASTPTGLLKNIITNFTYWCFVLLSKNNSRAFTVLLVLSFQAIADRHMIGFQCERLYEVHLLKMIADCCLILMQITLSDHPQ